MRHARVIGAAMVLGAVVWGCATGRGSSSAGLPQARVSSAKVLSESPVEAGRYLVQVAGCNDCHTPGFMAPGGENTPEHVWLTGNPVGFRGPWGTTYATNLRLFAKDFNEDQWVQVLRARKARPPMPWASLHAMSDADLKAVFRYIKSFEELGDPAPAYLPPGRDPVTPYIVFEPVMPNAAR